jgi:hypothetical protein
MQVAGRKPSVSHNIAQQRNPYAAVPYLYLTRKRMMMKQLEIRRSSRLKVCRGHVGCEALTNAPLVAFWRCPPVVMETTAELWFAAEFHVST